MPLPITLEVVPLTAPVQAAVTVPGSKSITNRLLILAALGKGQTTLRGALWSDDTIVVVECLRALGFRVDVQPESTEPANRRITVRGLGGSIPNAGTAEPLDLFVRNAGTAARFLAALVCLGKGTYRLSGTPRMHERPQAPLFTALRELGYHIDSPNGHLPAIIHGAGPKAGAVSVSVDESSQFASALLLSGQHAGWKVSTTGSNPEESPYVAMTIAMLKAFKASGEIQIEPDASSGSYFVGAGWLLKQTNPKTSVSVLHWPDSSWQIDSSFPRYLPLPEELSRLADLGDAIMTAIVLAPFASHPVEFTDLARLRLQESERVQALRTNLTALGAKVSERGDTLHLSPSKLHGGLIETYDDHRLAMSFAMLGLSVPGIRIQNPACVAKTFPNFFEKLAAAPPHGLGAELRDAATQRPLSASDLVTSDVRADSKPALPLR